MKKIISALLIGAAIVSLASCVNKAAPLHGDWHTEIALDEEAVSDVLAFYDFTAEEIALIDKSGFTTISAHSPIYSAVSSTALTSSPTTTPMYTATKATKHTARRPLRRSSPIITLSATEV